MNNKPVMQEKSFKETEIGKIPVDWEVSMLDEISLKVTDGSHFSPKESENGNKIIATVKDMEYYQFSFKNCKRISDEDFNILVKNGCSPEKGDIIISKDGANCLDLIFLYNQDKKIVLLSSIAIVKLKKGFNPQFYRYYLLSPIAQKIMREGYVSGSAIPRVILKDFKKVPIPILPNIETQNKIADILRSLDDKIALNRSMNSTLEAIGQALFKRWFVDFEFPNGEGKPYKSSSGEMVETELGEVPKGWRVGNLEDIIDNIKKPLKPGEHLKDRKYVPIDCLAMRQMGVESFQEYNDAQSSLIGFERDDILLGAMRVYFHRVNLSPFAGITRTTTFVLRPKKKEHVSFSLFLLNQESTINYANSHSKGTTMPYAVWEGSLSEMDIIIPKDEILTKFNCLIYPLLEKIRDQIFEQITLSKIRDALLPKLMSGEIKVK